MDDKISVPDNAVEQFFQVFVVTLQATHGHAMVIGQHEKRPGGPAAGHGDAELTASIVVEDPHPFKVEVLQKTFRIALNLQFVTILTARAQLSNVSLPPDFAVEQDHDLFADLFHVAQEMC